VFTKRRREGWLMIDNRNGPGVSAEFVQASGTNAPIVGAGICYESAIITCAHCGGTVILNPDRSRPRGYCQSCDHYVCDLPSCNGDCKPFRKLLEVTQELAGQDLNIKEL